MNLTSEDYAAFRLLQARAEANTPMLGLFLRRSAATEATYRQDVDAYTNLFLATAKRRSRKEYLRVRDRTRRYWGG